MLRFLLYVNTDAERRTMRPGDNYYTAARDYPATGAWNSSQHPGNRQFYTLPAERKVQLDVGATLSEVTIAYETWGTLNSDASNAVLLCHAWTGDSHAAGRATDGQPSPGWWESLIGPGLAIDTNVWFVVCTNVLGGCQGSSGD